MSATIGRTLGRETGQMTQSPVPPGGAKETGKVTGPGLASAASVAGEVDVAAARSSALVESMGVESGGSCASAITLPRYLSR